jgi:galactoside O-acetyltransferase
MVHLWTFFRDLLYGLFRNNSSLIALKARQLFLASDAFIDTNVEIANPSHLKMGKGCALYHGVCINNWEGEVSFGTDSHLGAQCYVNVCHGRLSVGSHVAVGPGTRIIVYSNHYIAGAQVTDTKICEDITIGDNVFIGANCVILPGAYIEDNVVIGAGSLVKGRLQSDGIYAGVPCRLLKSGWFTGTAGSRT